ncbi:MAG: AIM24 family protein [Paludibacteraceae bacterium]|nr:AIM24 family protein [Paludibacteraceae bacterium]
MDCKLTGYEFRTLQVTLNPGEKFYAEKGTLIYLESGIDKSLQTTSSSLTSIFKSKLSGESIFIIEYENKSSQPKKLSFASKAGILPIKLEGERFLCRRGTFIATTNKVELGLGFSIKGAMGGVSFLQKIEGTATVFIDSIGAPITLKLAPSETVEVDEKHLLALQGISENQISANWSLSNVLHGEGISLLQITGPGIVHISPTALM